MRYHHLPLLITLVIAVILPLQSWADDDQGKTDDIMAEVYMGDNAVKMKKYVQQVFRDVLFTFTLTLEDIPENLEKVEITIKSHDVKAFVNGNQLEIKVFIEELYREFVLGILTAMGETPDRSGEFRVIVYAT